MIVTLWLKISPPPYELPLAVADNATELARMTGVRANSIHEVRSRARREGKWCPYITVDIDDEEDN